MKIFALLFAIPLYGHVVSMSYGDLTIDGATATYKLRMPVWEITHLADPGKTLLDNIRFEGGRLLSHGCTRDQESLNCTAKYLFNRDVDELKVVCRLHAVTVANHIHIFRAVKASGASEQAFYDITYPESTLTFRPPSAAELFLKAATEGFRRGITGLTTILFLFAIAVVAKDRKQFLTLSAILIAVEITTASFPSVRLSLKFLEAAAALSTAYLAIEKLLVPEAGQRWLVVAILGIFHGLFFHFFNAEGPSAGFATGLLVANAAWMLPASLLRFLPSKPLAVLLFLVGTFWFGYRMLN